MKNKIYYCSKEEFIKNSKIPVRVVKNAEAMYREMAAVTAQTIKANNKCGERTVVISPVGPIDQYPILAEMVNSQNISLKNCWFINMDEYLGEDGCLISYDSPLSFRRTMDRVFYSKVKSELLMPTEQRIFPESGKECEIDEMIKKFDKVDLCLTGVGINGHIAFNEPALQCDSITDDEYKNIGTRCLDIAIETIVNNGARKLKGALDIFPKRCITLGMKQLLKAEKFKIYLNCDWQWGISRKIALSDESRFTPASFLQSHKDSEMIILEDTYNFKLED